MNRYVRNFGGSLVTDMLGTTSPPFPNADYVFRVENIVAELKCLCEDKTDDEKLQASIQKLFDGYVDRGLIPNPGYGKFVVQSKDLPVELQNDLYRILARPIKRRLDKANKQIKRTKEHLKMDSAHGLVLLANDGNFKLEPAQFAHAVNVALGNDFSAIDNLVLFTVNMLATVPKMERHALVWMSASRNGHPVVSEEFLNRFFVGWTRHISSVIGEEVPIVGPIAVSY